MSEVTLSHEPGLDGLPDEKTWAKWQHYLTKQERVVYLWLRWITTAPSFSGETTIQRIARDIGDEDNGWKWESRGSMSQAATWRALKGLAALGLVEMQDEDEF